MDENFVNLNIDTYTKFYCRLKRVVHDIDAKWNRTVQISCTTIHTIQLISIGREIRLGRLRHLPGGLGVPDTVILQGKIIQVHFHVFDDSLIISVAITSITSSSHYTAMLSTPDLRISSNKFATIFKCRRPSPVAKRPTRMAVRPRDSSDSSLGRLGDDTS